MDLPSCLVGNSLDHGVRLEKSASSGSSSSFFFSNLLVKCRGEWQNVFTHSYFSVYISFPPFVHTAVIDSHP